jgi:hypothetical protein
MLASGDCISKGGEALNHVFAARILLSILCSLQGLATLAIDFNRTHATNPAWTGHARFHVVWQSISVGLLSVLELVLIWLQGPYQRDGFYLALFLAAVSPLAFTIAFVSRRIFGGALSDPNGIPPVRLMLFGLAISIDLNFVAVVAALLSIGAILAIY